MENALLVGLSRQMVLSHELDVVANNIANIDTTGFKADKAAFSEFLMPHAADQQFPGRDSRVSFVQDRATWIDFSPGSIQHTGDPLNVALDGKGYLVVQTPRGQRYTRNGALSTNATGQLVTSEGDQVLGDGGPITFQPTDHDISISPNGIITVREGSSTADSQRGKLQIVGFDQPQQPTEGFQLHLHGAERRQCRPAAARHPRHARRDREIERQCRRRDGADDPDKPAATKTSPPSCNSRATSAATRCNSCRSSRPAPPSSPAAGEG